MAAPGEFTLDEYLGATLRTISESIASPSFRQAVVDATTACVATLRAGGKLLIAGNGGSAADAQHIAGHPICATVEAMIFGRTETA